MPLHRFSLRFLGFGVALAALSTLLTHPASAQSYVRLIEPWKGSYLFENGNQLKYGSPAATDQSSHWLVEDASGGQVRIKNRLSGEYVNIQSNLAYVEVTAVSPTLNTAKWTLADTSGYKRILSVAQPTKAVNVQAQLGYAQCTSLSATYKSTWWTLEPVAGATPTPTPTPTATPTPNPTRGATVPWKSYEAEAGVTNGTVLAPSRVVGTAAAECSGRRGVTLDATGEYVQWTTTAAANAIAVRLSIPDAATGGGTTSTLNLYVNGVLRQPIEVTSKYSWLYGPEGNPVNTPDTGGLSRHMFDESSAVVGNIPAGATVMLRKDATNEAAYYTMDFIDLEQAPAALTMPAGYVSITNFGATANDNTDDYQAILAAYNAAKSSGQGIWIPPGTFRQSQRLTVEDVSIKGAGIWYSKLLSHITDGDTDNKSAGFWVMDNCQFSDFAIFGEMTKREHKNVSAFRGTFGTNSIIENIWSEHVECFVWAGSDSSSMANVLPNGLIVRNNRIRNTMADGINFASGTRNSLMENNHARNNGDDSFAIYSSPRQSDTQVCYGNSIVNCTSQLPWRASGISIYGGHSNTVTNCAVSDTLTYPGIAVQRGADSRPFGTGQTLLSGIDVIRCGGIFWTGQQYGAVWSFTNTGTISNGNIKFQNINVYDASYSGIHVQSNNGLSQTGVTFDGIQIQGAGTHGVYIRSGATGSGTFNNVTVSGAVSSGLRNDATSTYTLTKGTGNSGW